jgi:hypothetical protein
MTDTWRDYRGFKITTNKTHEDAQGSIPKGAIEAVVAGYYFYVWQPTRDGETFRRVRNSPDYATEAEAVAKAQEVIDEILNNSTEQLQ